MKGFEEYLDKMGYSWSDFDSTHEMESLIEQYADEKVKEQLKTLEDLKDFIYKVCPLHIEDDLGPM